MEKFKPGDWVVLDNSDTKVYQISSYSRIWNGFIMKCGGRFSYSLVKRKASPEEVKAGKRSEVS